MQRPHLALIFVVVALGIEPFAHAAKMLPARDVDALMWSAHDVVLAEIAAHQLDPANPKRVAGTTVTVRQVIQGEMQVGQEVAFSNIGEFHLPRDFPVNPGPANIVPVNSTVVLFTRKPTARSRPAEVFENGLWIVHAGLVYEFKQHWPGRKNGIPTMSPWPGYTARTRMIDPQYTPLLEADLRKTLEASQKRIAAYHELLDGPADAAKVERYFELYQARTGGSSLHRDPIADAAGSQFARAAPVDRVLELLLREPGGVRSAFSPFSAAFESRAAREYLLQQLENPQTGADRLRSLAEAADAVDFRYSHSTRGPAEAGDLERFFERCAKVAVDRSETEAAAVLIRVIESAAQSMRGSRVDSSPLQADIAAAEQILLSTAAWKSADARFRAAIFARDAQPADAQRDHPAVITVVRSVRVQRSKDGEVLYAAFDWDSKRPRGSVRLQSSLVVRSIDGTVAAQFSMPPPPGPIKHLTRGDFQRYEPNKGNDVIEFAVDQPLPEAEYDVFLRFRDGQEIVAEGVPARLTLKR